MATTQVQNFEQLRAVLNGIGAFKELRSFAAPLRTCALYLNSAARQRFDQGASPDGVPWAALIRPSKRRGGASAKPLRDTGILMASLTSRATGHIEEITDTALEWGTNVSYAAFHQHGTARMVARPFLGVTPKDEERMATIILDWAEKRLKAG
jgi:phage virion morphogenesis protein